MAISLLVALIALGLLHVMPQLARCRGDGLFRRWVTQLADTSGSGRVALALLLPTVLCALLWWLLGHTPLGGLLQLLFSLTVLLYCFGPREFEADLEAVLGAPDGVSRGFDLYYTKRDMGKMAQVANYSVDTYGLNMNFGYPVSEIEDLAFGVGYAHNDIHVGFAPAQEISGSPSLASNVTSYA